MTKQEAVEIFGSMWRLAKAIKRDHAQVSRWPDGELTEHNTRLVKLAIKRAEKRKEHSK